MSAVCREIDSETCIINKWSLSGLAKNDKDSSLLSAEVYDVLFKLLKWDNENTSGDVQLLCQLFSGEETSYQFATKSTREIATNTTFCIRGSIQLPFAAQLITQLDQGHGLLDRF